MLQSLQVLHGVLAKAAALMRSLIKNHPSIDGNKRTAVLAAFVFTGGAARGAAGCAPARVAGEIGTPGPMGG
ncbi:MAG: Fic family protein [Patescibacteria group bacterium]